MTTHQELAGMSDDDLLQRMLGTFDTRFDEQFWRLYEAQVVPRLPKRPVIVDLGCGPGLFLQAAARRSTGATLHGYDVTKAMLDHAEEIPYPGAESVTLALHDVAAGPLPLENASVHLLASAEVLHLFDDPFDVLAEVRRVLAPDGLFLLHDWVRGPLEPYLMTRRPEIPDDKWPEVRRQWLRLFPVHNRYSVEDWRWVLAEAGFMVEHAEASGRQFWVFLARPSPK